MHTAACTSSTLKSFTVSRFLLGCNVLQDSKISAFQGSRTQVSVHRAVGEFRMFRPQVLYVLSRSRSMDAIIFNALGFCLVTE